MNALPTPQLTAFRTLNPATPLASALCALEPAALGRTPRRIPPWASSSDKHLRWLAVFPEFVSHCRLLWTLEIAREVADALIPVAGSAPTPGIEREDISGHHLAPPVTGLTESARRPVGYSP